MKKFIVFVGVCIVSMFLASCGCVEQDGSETEPQYPLAVITIDGVLPILAGDVFYFSANTSMDPDGSISEYYWELSDGSIESNQYFEYEYAETGDYEVSLRVIDNDGLTNQTRTTVTVVPIPLVNLSIYDATINESTNNILFNISIVGTQYHAVRIADMGTDLSTQFDDNNTRSGGFTQALRGDYVDVDGDEYASVGDYIVYEWEHNVTVGTLELNPYSFTYMLRYHTHKPQLPSLGEVTYYFA